MTASINYPYTIDPDTGAVQVVNSTAKIYLDKVVTLLSTNIGQRPMTPTYGVDWSSAMFENQGESQAAIHQAISQAIAKWIPGVTVAAMSISGSGLSGTETISLTLNLPDSTTTTLAVNSNILNYDGTIAG